MVNTSVANKNLLLRKWDADIGESDLVRSSTLSLLTTITVVQLMKSEKIDSFGGVPSTINDLLQRSAKITNAIQVIITGGAPLPNKVPGAISKKFPQAVL
jgi:acyl-CoA synthetase (AMP-forming)/AMP-acid ligase II